MLACYHIPMSPCLAVEQSSNSPDQGPQDSGRQEKSHDTSHPHTRDHAGIGVKGQIQRLIHPSVEGPSVQVDRSQGEECSGARGMRFLCSLTLGIAAFAVCAARAKEAGKAWRAGLSVTGHAEHQLIRADPGRRDRCHVLAVTRLAQSQMPRPIWQSPRQEGANKEGVGR